MTAHCRLPLALLAMTMLGACGAGSEPAGQADETPAVEDTVFGAAVGTIDKAEAVQDTVNTHKQEMDRRIDEGGEAP